MKISQVIVVEGKNDIAAVKRAIDADVVSTSGFGITKEKLEFLKMIEKKRGLIILMDPDSPGEKIRAIISEQVPNAKHAFITKKDALVKGDVGIENASVKAILASLENLVSPSSTKALIDIEDLIQYDLIFSENSSQLREKLGTVLNIGMCNGKTLLKRLNMLKLNKLELKTLMEDLNAK